MVALYVQVLTLNHITDADQIVLGDFLQRFFISFQRMVFTALGFVEHSLFTFAGKDRLNVDPTTVQVTGYAGAGFRVTAKLAHFGLKLSCGRAAICRTLYKQRFELRVLDIFGAGLEAFLAIFAGFDQVVQDRDGFFIKVSHFSIPC